MSRYDLQRIADDAHVGMSAHGKNALKASAARVETIAKAMFKTDWPRDDWDRFGPKDFATERYRAMAVTAIAYLSPVEQAPQPVETEAHVLVPEALTDLTFAIQHNPNCPGPWLVRLPGKSGRIDFKPYRDQLGIVPHQTGDFLGFGKTLDEAASAAIKYAEDKS